MAQVDPLPFVPATWIIVRSSCGLPIKSKRRKVCSNPSFIPRRWRLKRDFKRVGKLGDVNVGDCADIGVNKSSCKRLKGIPGICNIAMYLTRIFIRNYIVFT